MRRGFRPFTLVDDGTLDTVVRCKHGREFRYSAELRAEYIDPVHGGLDFPRFRREVVVPDCQDFCESEIPNA